MRGVACGSAMRECHARKKGGRVREKQVVGKSPPGLCSLLEGVSLPLLDLSCASVDLEERRLVRLEDLLHERPQLLVEHLLEIARQLLPEPRAALDHVLARDGATGGARVVDVERVQVQLRARLRQRRQLPRVHLFPQRAERRRRARVRRVVRGDERRALERLEGRRRSRLARDRVPHLGDRAAERRARRCLRDAGEHTLDCRRVLGVRKRQDEALRKGRAVAEGGPRLLRRSRSVCLRLLAAAARRVHLGREKSGTDLFLSLPKCRTPTFAICQKLNSKNPPKKPNVTRSHNEPLTMRLSQMRLSQKISAMGSL